MKFRIFSKEQTRIFNKTNKITVFFFFLITSYYQHNIMEFIIHCIMLHYY